MLGRFGTNSVTALSTPPTYHVAGPPELPAPYIVKLIFSSECTFTEVAMKHDLWNARVHDVLTRADRMNRPRQISSDAVPFRPANIDSKSIDRKIQGRSEHFQRRSKNSSCRVIGSSTGSSSASLI